MKNTNLGIAQADLKKVADAFSRMLADTYLLSLKTQNFHWNVTGENFMMLHELFGSQYDELSQAVDVLAERIRALGYPAPASFFHFSKLSAIQEEQGQPSTMKMIEQLLADHELLARTARELFSIATAAHDEAGANILAERMEKHEKAAWMLRSSLA